ncbi:proline-specific peptidase [Astrocystis sublimbata]|nr:proline-specific peptidase [Astrocystis sublimbata]
MMAESHFREGKVPFDVPSVASPCFTYYKIFGDLTSKVAPVVVAHGGPGAGHEYLLTFADLWRRYGIPVVFYDQIGCASSTHLPQTAGDESFWQEQLFQDELDNLLDKLDLRSGSGFHFLGQSWGAMLGASFAARRPPGLQKLVLASGLASKELGGRGVRLLREQMPSDMQEALSDAEQAGEYESPEYRRALDYYYRKHVCRAKVFPPPELVPSVKHVSEDATVYRTIFCADSHNHRYGPSPLAMIGSLRDWTVVPRLHNITAPTLVYSGEFDTSHDVAQVPFREIIPDVRSIIVPDAGHMCHLEDGGLRERVLNMVGDFLTDQKITETQAV